MTGEGPICLKIDQHTFAEHIDYQSARREANRLADKLQAPIVIYVPVLMVAPPKRTVETPIPVAPDVLTLIDNQAVDNDPLPF